MKTITCLCLVYESSKRVKSKYITPSKAFIIDYAVTTQNEDMLSQ